MSFQQVHALLMPPNLERSQERTLDFLNANFKSWEQYDALQDSDSLLEDARARSEALDARLASSQSELDTVISRARKSAASHLHAAQELSLLRHSLADELSYLSQELVSSMSDDERRPTLLEDIETLHRSLKELQSVKAYVQIISHALTLSEASVKHLQEAGPSMSFNHESIKTYQSLQAFVGSVTKACSDVEDGMNTQKLHLATFLEGVRDKTWSDIKVASSTTFIQAAEKLGWPMVVDYPAASVEDRKIFESAFVNLLKLQKIGEKIRLSEDGEKIPEKEGVYSVQALVQPVALRFKYHFDGTRQTNRLDKPEWYFTHVLNITHEHRSFMETIVQPLLSSNGFRSINAWREFTSLLLPLLSRKLRRTAPSLLARPSLLAHTIYQALAFDGALKEAGFDYAGTSAKSDAVPDTNSFGWKGVSDVILGREQWFDAWLEGERKFAEDQYLEIISSPDAWLIVVDDQDAEQTSNQDLRPTNSARRVKSLVEQITDRYTPLPDALHRTRFLTAAQLPLLDSYRTRMAASLDAFETLSSSFVRAVPGALGVGASGSGAGADQGVVWGGDTRRMTAGVEGLQRLCKAMISAKHVASAMEGWGEELFFLELWTEISRRPDLQALARRSGFLPEARASDADAPDSAIFDELISSYDQLTIRAEEMMIEHIYSEVEAGLKAHYNASAHSPPQHDELQFSPSLLTPVALLSSHLTFLQRTLPSASVTVLYRTVAGRLAEHILQRHLLARGRGRLAPRDGRFLQGECELWAQTCRTVFAREPGARVDAPWRRLLQAGRALGAEGDAWRNVRVATFGALDDDRWAVAMGELLGVSEIDREDMSQILRLRADCDM